MRLPSKFISFKESILPKFIGILTKLQEYDMTVLELYKRFKGQVENIDEFIEILDCLFALGKISYNGEVLHYVG